MLVPGARNLPSAAKRAAGWGQMRGAPGALPRASGGVQGRVLGEEPGTRKGGPWGAVYCRDIRTGRGRQGLEGMLRRCRQEQ